MQMKKMMKGVYVFLALVLGAPLLAAQFSATVRAEAAVLVNADSGEILFEKNANQIRYPASITKIASVWYILEKFGHRLDENVITSKEALKYSPVHLKRSQPDKFPSHHLEAGATLMNLVPQEVLSARAMLYGMLLISANDAANALVEHFSGSNAIFMADLNRFLREKGFKDTSFNNPHGLHHEKHTTTALEMARITALAFQNPLFREMISTKIYEKPASNMKPAASLRPFNRLVVPGRYYYPKVIGGKTGHTSRAGFTFVAIAEHSGRKLIAVLLGCKEADDRYRDAKVLFETAFREKKVVRTLLTSEHDRFTFQIKGAKHDLHAKMLDDLKLEYYPSEEPQLKSIIEWSIPSLPIAEGRQVGKIVIYNDQGQRLLHQPLVALNNVEPTFWKYCDTAFRGWNGSKRMFPILIMVCAVSFASLGILKIFKKKKDYGKGR